MKLLPLLLLTFELALLRAEDMYQFPEEWHEWKREHRREYGSTKDELQRYSVWLSNKQYIDSFNNNNTRGFMLKMNELGDLTSEEYLKQYKCIRDVSYSNNHARKRHSYNYTLYSPPLNVSLPVAVNWSSENVVTSVKKQDGCCACYAFSAVGTLEGAHALTSGQLTSLSAQNIIDCSNPYGNHGCEKGSMVDSFMYTIDMGGIDTEESYPYEGVQGKCRFNKKKVGTAIRNVIRVMKNSEPDLQAAVALEGPVSMAIDGSHNTFRFYQRGIFDEPNCSTTKITHAMLLVGYGRYNGKDYWLVKNSWGTEWGQDGYIMMARNKANQCGVATRALFPTL